MRCSQLVRILLILSAIATQSLAGDPFRDEFDDGSFSDGKPVSWGTYTSPWDKGTFTVENGSLVLWPNASGPSSGDNYWEIDAYAKDQLYHDVSVLTRLRGLNQGNSAVGIGAIDTDSTLGPSGNGAYFGIIRDGGSAVLQTGYNFGTSNSNYTVATQLSHQSQDVYLWMDIVGQSMALKAWPADAAEPILPNLLSHLTNSLRDATGHVFVWAGSRATVVPTAFRFVDVTPDPTTRGSVALSPQVEYTLRDTKFDGMPDGEADVALTNFTFSRIGEFDGSSNFEERLVQKYELPKSPGLASRLQKATLRLHVNSLTGPPEDALSIFHSQLNNTTTVQLSDYSDSTYVDTKLDVIEATEGPGYYDIDVTSLVLTDLLRDGDSPIIAFRFQVNEAVHPEDEISRYYQVASRSNQPFQPMLVLTFVPEPASAFSLAAITPILLIRFRGRHRRNSRLL